MFGPFEAFPLDQNSSPIWAGVPPAPPAPGAAPPPTAGVLTSWVPPFGFPFFGGPYTINLTGSEHCPCPACDTVGGVIQEVVVATTVTVDFDPTATNLPVCGPSSEPLCGPSIFNAMASFTTQFDSLGGLAPPDEWTAIVTRMGARAKSATQPELEIVAKYLAASFPKVEDATKVNVNKAGAKEIADGLGLTEQEADLIVEFRTKHGSFREWGDLLIIYGLNGRKVQAAKDRMSF